MILEISRDLPALERGALELMEYSAKSEAMGDRASLLAAPELSPAHMAWLQFLFRVERQGGPELALRADVADGLGAVRKARAAFERKNRQCRCGRWVPRLAKICLCGMKFDG
jgi:hypothetical protein